MSSIPALTFIGDFNKLKQLGYIFGKAYAKNYKYYNKEITIDSDVTIWVKHKKENVYSVTLIHSTMSTLDFVTKNMINVVNIKIENKIRRVK